MSPPVSAPTPGAVLWAPRPTQIQPTRLAAYMRWLAAERGLRFDSYDALWRWSVDELKSFWQSIWDFFDVQATGSCEPVLGLSTMPGAQWYPNAKLNYAEHVFRCASDERPALVARSEDTGTHEVSWAQLKRDTGALAAHLRTLGVGPGDRVASYMPNRPETVVAFLACASIGAIWSSSAPDMGATVVLDRFRQIEPKVLLAVDSYSYNGKIHDRRELVDELLLELPSVRHVIHVAGPICRAASHRPPAWRDRLSWQDSVAADAELQFERMPFDHPLWIVYSSGTTGLPKAIVHSHGGIVLTHLKTMVLQHDLRPADRLLFLGGTGWIVWNLQLGALLTGASIVLYDGNPAYPDQMTLWRFAERTGITCLGLGAPFIQACEKAGLRPGRDVDLSKIRTVGSTGAPLPPEGFAWVYDAVAPDVMLSSLSGGTDVCTAFVGGAPELPVRAGVIPAALLGCAVEAFDEDGLPVIEEVGELVITEPMPSMPVGFWGDHDGSRLRAAYYETYPGVWRHGDWVLWDNRSVMHQANPDYDMNERRFLYRLMLKGEVPA